jgi:hypothetical protein
MMQVKGGLLHRGRADLAVHGGFLLNAADAM